MRNKIQTGNVIDVVAVADVKSGDLVKVGDLVGVAVTDAATGETFALELKGVYEVPKATGAITAGAKLYLVAADSNVSTTAASNTFAGHAIAPAANGDATVLMRLSN